MSQTLTNGLVKDALRCIRMRQFAVLSAQFAVFVVTLHKDLILLDELKVDMRIF